MESGLHAMTKERLAADSGSVKLHKSFAERLGTDWRLLPVAAGLLVLFIFFSFESDVFLTSRNISNLLVQSTVTGIIALGLFFVLLVGEIDLSVAAISGVTSVVMSRFVVAYGLPVPFAVSSAIVCGALVGLASGMWISFVSVPSFVVTLGVGLVLNGIQLALLPSTGRYSLMNTGIEKIAGTFLTGQFAWAFVCIAIFLFGGLRWSIFAARRKVGVSASFSSIVAVPLTVFSLLFLVTVYTLVLGRGVPLPLVLFMVLLGLAGYVATETKFGLHLYAIGNNIEAARRGGIRVQRVKIAAFAIAGGLSGIAGVVAASRILGVSVSSGGGIGGGALLLESIAAAVIGGISLFGGRGRVIGALVGALIIATVSNGLNLMGVGDQLRLVVTGLLLVLAVSIDRGIERLAGSGA